MEYQQRRSHWLPVQNMLSELSSPVDDGKASSLGSLHEGKVFVACPV